MSLHPQPCSSLPTRAASSLVSTCQLTVARFQDNRPTPILEARAPRFHFHTRIRQADEVLLSSGAQDRWAEPQEIAKAVPFLASDESSHANAVELEVDQVSADGWLGIGARYPDRSTFDAKIYRRNISMTSEHPTIGIYAGFRSGLLLN